jgi:hypothetical protein
MRLRLPAKYGAAAAACVLPGVRRVTVRRRRIRLGPSALSLSLGRGLLLLVLLVHDAQCQWHDASQKTPRGPVTQAAVTARGHIAPPA